MHKNHKIWGFGLIFWSIFAFCAWTPLAFASTTLTPMTGATTNTAYTLSQNDAGNIYDIFYWYDPSNNFVGSANGGADNLFTHYGVTATGVYTVVSYAGSGYPACYTNYAGCLATGNILSQSTMTIGGGGGGGAEPWPNGLEVFPNATSTPTTTIQFSIVDNPTQDYFDGVVLFFIACVGVMFIFKKK